MSQNHPVIPYSRFGVIFEGLQGNLVKTWHKANDFEHSEHNNRRTLEYRCAYSHVLHPCIHMYIHTCRKTETDRPDIASSTEIEVGRSIKIHRFKGKHGLQALGKVASHRVRRPTIWGFPKIGDSDIVP